MKRLITLDLLRGFAIFAMLASHVMLHVYYYANDFDAIMANPVLIAVFVPIYLASHFRAFFLMISMTIHGYIVVRSLKAGNSSGAVLKKQLITAGLLYLVALFTEGFSAYHGVLGNTLRSGYWRGDTINHILHFETLQSIAVSIAFLSTLLVLLYRGEGMAKERRNVLVLGCFGIILVVLAPFVHEWVNILTGGGYYVDKGQYAFDSVGEFFAKLGLAALAGIEQPIFPFMATTCIGGIVGIFMARDTPIPDLPRKGKFAGLGLILTGVLVLAATGFDVELEFYVHPTWFYLVLNGLQLIILMTFLGHYEYNPEADLEKYTRRTRFFRRWSMVSLTVFVWQFLPERLLEVLGYLITGINYIERGQTGHLETIVMVVLVLAFWDLLIRLWERAKFRGTFEWIMVTLGQLALYGRKGAIKQSAERLDIGGVLYDPEPVSFVSERSSNNPDSPEHT